MKENQDENYEKTIVSISFIMLKCSCGENVEIIIPACRFCREALEYYTG
ncbi:MAG: hypothetical protein ACLU4N_10720 [Butyricimonas faecihominis]